MSWWENVYINVDIFYYLLHFKEHPLYLSKAHLCLYFFVILYLLNTLLNILSE